MLVSPCQVKNKTFLLTKDLFGSYLLAHCSSLTAKSSSIFSSSLSFSYTQSCLVLQKNHKSKLFSTFAAYECR